MCNTSLIFLEHQNFGMPFAKKEIIATLLREKNIYILFVDGSVAMVGLAKTAMQSGEIILCLFGILQGLKACKVAKSYCVYSEFCRA